MIEIVAVILVPVEGDPSRVLGGARCHARPPIVYFDTRDGGWVEFPWRDNEPHALPVWWDGALVPEGWDRWRRVLRGFRMSARAEPRLEDVVALANLAPTAARVVCLGMVDGRLVEVTP